MQKLTAEAIMDHIILSFKNADNDYSKLPAEVLLLEGFSGTKTRHLYNNLCSLAGTRYLEVGSWRGSTFVSALYNNHAEGCSVDNWSELDGPKDAFVSVVREHLEGRATTTAVDGDCFALDAQGLSDMGQFDVYLYDGEHSYDSHRKAITHFKDSLRDKAIVVVDDWNWECVRRGTYDGFLEAGLAIEFMRAKQLTADDTHTEIEAARQGYWNGVAVFLVTKRPVQQNR